MKTDNSMKQRADRVWLTEASCDLEDFRAEVERTVSLADYPHAERAEKNVLIYDGASVLKAAATHDGRRAVLAEICEAFATGPGVIVLKQAFEDTAVIDAASGIFDDIINEQHRTNSGGGDHFAKPGANDRIWEFAGKALPACAGEFCRLLRAMR